MQSETLTPKKRYYRDNGRASTAPLLTALEQQVHALFTHWVRANYAPHDFIEALAHQGDLFQVEYLLDGEPDCRGETQEALVTTALAPTCSRVVPPPDPRAGRFGLSRTPLPMDLPPERFYTAKGDLNVRVDDSAHRPALAAYFVQWLADGWLARDFTQALRDCAATVVHDYGLCESFGGLGGGKTAEQFLTTAYHAPL